MNRCFGHKCAVCAPVGLICHRPEGPAFADAEGGEVEDDLAAGVLESENEPGISLGRAEGVADMERLAREREITVTRVSAMRELGLACGIAVGASAAGLLKSGS